MLIRTLRHCLILAVALKATNLAYASEIDVQITTIESDVFELMVAAEAADGKRIVKVGAGPQLEITIRAIDSFGRAGVPGLEISWRAEPNEIITGLGQRFDSLDQYGMVVEMWIEDAPLQTGGRSYFCAPVLYSSAGYAMAAADNPEGYFDLNSTGDGRHRYVRAGRELSLTVVMRPTLASQVRTLMPHIGLPRSVPDWAWGPWISRNSYENQAEAEAALRGMIERDIPVSVIVQEAWKGPSEEGAFNRWEFPGWDDVAGFLELCASVNVNNVLWQVPVIHPSSPLYTEGEEKGYFVLAPDGSVRLREQWLAGFANIDLTNPEAVIWWQDQMRPLVRAGAVGFKADDGEDIYATDVFHDGRRGWAMHNEYTLLYAKALADLLEQEQVDGMIWARSASIGQQRYPALWAGDQRATWPQMRSLIPAGLSSSISGMPFWSHDIGGYVGRPTPELYIRWTQFGALSPLMQYHGVEPREPWEFGDEAEHAYAYAARARMNLVPHLMALAKEATETGAPIMRPMGMVFPDDPALAREDTQYMLGEDLLVAPIIEPGAPGRAVRFPEGRWRHATQRVVYEGPGTARVPIGLIDLPLFVREGARTELALKAGHQLGEWEPDSPVRLVGSWFEAPLILDLDAPLAASSAEGDVLIRFQADLRDEARVQWRWNDEQETWRDASVVTQGDAFTADLTPPQRSAGRRQQYRVLSGREELLTGEVWYRDPVAIESDQITIGADPRTPTVKVRNTLAQAFEGRMHWRSNAFTAVPAEIPIKLSADGTITFSPSLTRSGAQVGLLAAELEIEHNGRRLSSWELPVHGGVRWAIAGPFESDDNSRLFGATLGPGYIHTPDAAFGDGSARWHSVYPQDPGVLDLRRLVADIDHAGAYTLTRIRSDRRQTVELRFGSDDTLIVWVNGRRVHAAETYREAEPDQEVVAVELREGVNTIVAQVTQDINDWMLLFRVTGPGGSTVSGLTDGFDDFEAFDRQRGPGDRTVRVERQVWQLAGPFPIDRAITEGSPELGIDARARQGALDWRRLEQDPGALAGVDLLDAAGRDGNQVVYVRTEVRSDTPRLIDVRAGADDGLVAWFNGELVLNQERPQGFKPEQFVSTIDAPAGTSELLFRVSQRGGDWRFQCELYDAESGIPIGIRVIEDGDRTH